MNCINSYWWVFKSKKIYCKLWNNKKYFSSSTPLKQNALVEQSLDLKLRASKAKYYLKWGSFNVVILAILMFDISNKCPYAESNWYYVEYVAAAIVGLSMLACFLKYFLYIFYTQPVQGTRQQKNLMKFDDNGLLTSTSIKILFNN